MKRMRGRITQEQWQMERLYDFVEGRMQSEKVSEAALGEVLGISQQAVNYNKQHRSFSLEQMLQIFNFFGVDITDCLRYRPERRSKG